MSGAWYVGRAGWRRSFRALLFLGLVAGLVGGVVLGAVAGARRTSTAYDRLLHASGNPEEVLFLTADSPEIPRFLRDHPEIVDRFAPATGMIGRRIPQQDWYSVDAPEDWGTFGLSFLRRGRFPNPDRADEVLITGRTASNTGLDVGDTFSFNAYKRSQTPEILRDPWTTPRGAHITAKVVGITRDPTDAQVSQTIKVMYGTPAFAREHHEDSTFTLYAVWLKGGPSKAPVFEQALSDYAREARVSSLLDVVSSRDDADAADHSARAVAMGLAIFALVGGLAGVITVVQATRRYVARADDEQGVLVSLGASRADRAATQFVSAVPFLVVAPFVAIAIAYASSALFPIGSTRVLEPQPGLRADLPVYAFGALAWLGFLAAMTAVVAWAGTSTRQRAARARRTRGVIDNASGPSALPASIGIRYALVPTTPRSTLQRMALFGLVVSVVGVVGCGVFAASLRELTHTPARFGLAYDISVELPSSGSEPVVDQLASDPDVAAVATMHCNNIDVFHRARNACSVKPRAGTVTPVIRTGRLPRDATEIAVGPKLLSAMHEHVGGITSVQTPNGSHDVRIVGTVLSPDAESSEFNAEVVVTPDALHDFTADPTFDTVEAIARLRPGVDRDKVLSRLDAQFPYGVSDESVPGAPGPIRNLEQIVRLPLILGLFFAILGAAAIGQALFMTSRQRRSDFAVLRSLGFTRRQVSLLIASSSTTFAVLALLIGVPLGIVAGRAGWSAVADNLFVAPAVRIPVIATVFVALGLLGFATLLALLPGRLLARLSPGEALRTE
jgi:hypothetical protein